MLSNCCRFLTCHTRGSAKSWSSLSTRTLSNNESATSSKNVGFYREAKNPINILAPVAHALDRLQSDHTSIADACNAWVRLITEECLQQHKAKVQNRFDQVITPNHLLAYCLYPTYRAQDITPRQVHVAHELLIAKDPDLMANSTASRLRQSHSLSHYFTTVVLGRWNQVCGGLVSRKHVKVWILVLWSSHYAAPSSINFSLNREDFI